jgi:hypothetical protein
MRTTVFLALLLALVTTSAHARRWQNLHVGHREFQTDTGADGVTVVYSVTADLVGDHVVFDVDIDRRGRRVSQSIAQLRLTKPGLPPFEAVLQTFDRWRDHAKAEAMPAFDLQIAHVGDVEWRFHWSGTAARLESGAGLVRRPVILSEKDVTVFRLLLFSAAAMEQEIVAFSREQQERMSAGPAGSETIEVRKERKSRKERQQRKEERTSPAP